MSDHRVLAPQTPPGEKVMGPASYFPSIEKNYGRPVQDWLDLAVQRLESDSSHMEVVGWLKSEHGMGHGHANAIVGYVRAELAKAE
jgi:monomeric isocitrate dehydrogenase